MVSNTQLCYFVFSGGSQDHQHDGQEEWIVVDCRYRGREIVIRLANGSGAPLVNNCSWLETPTTTMRGRGGRRLGCGRS